MYQNCCEAAPRSETASWEPFSGPHSYTTLVSCVTCGLVSTSVLHEQTGRTSFSLTRVCSACTTTMDGCACTDVVVNV
ncbi:hypothetical protein DPMN_166317 [Dreissena polymorpha]|uniref:Uncharacterized protein n=1 Tax=Dreissena polymorpha TaxID=45954 RepID=A0A9D4EWM8_DREPO|nr:hypothetical protein DPMN_166317 [Dreissena polymorpha]